MKSSLVTLLLSLIGMLSVSAFAADEVKIIFDQPQTAGICGYRAMWNTPVPMSQDGARAIVDTVVKDRGGVAVWIPNDRKGKPAPISFDAMNRSLLVRFPDAAEKIAEHINKGYAITKIDLVLPFADEELFPEGSTNWAPPEGGYLYRANWGVDTMYRNQRPTSHAIAFALRKPWNTDANDGPTYNAYIKGAGYWSKFGAQDVKDDIVAVQFGPTSVNYKEPDGTMDITAIINDKSFGNTLADRLRAVADCGFMVRKWETYDARYYSGAYEWGTGTGCRAIIINTPKLVVTFSKNADAQKIDKLVPAVDIPMLAEDLQKTGKGGKATAFIPSREELEKIAAKYSVTKPAWMPEWQWVRVKEMLAVEGGEAIADEPFWFQFVEGYVKGRFNGKYKDSKGVEHPGPDPVKIYETWVDHTIGKPYRGWFGFEAAPAMLPWFVYKDAMPAVSQEWNKNYWTAWLMPDKVTAETDAKRKDFRNFDGTLIHPQADDYRVGGPEASNPDPASGKYDTYYAKTGDWRGNKSFYRSGYCYTMSTTNFNNTASMGALLGGAIINSKNAIEDGRHGQANYPLKLWTWFDGSTQEELDDYYFGVTIRAQKMVADFGPETVDRMLGKSMLMKSMTMLVDDYHPGLRRYVTGSSRTAIYLRLVSQDGLYSVLNSISKLGTYTDVGEKDLPEGESKFGHEFPPADVARQATQSPYAPEWYQHVVDEKALPYEVTAAYKMWGSFMEKPLMRRSYLGKNYGMYSVNAQTGIVPITAQWRRQDKQVATSRDLGTMFVRMGVNKTNWVSEAPGWMSSSGNQAVLQKGNKMVVVTSPWAWLDPNRKITSIQSSIAFHNYEKPAPTWEIYVADQKITAFPVKAKALQSITIKDGVTFIGIIPLPSTNLGRTDEVVLREGDAQTYLNGHSAKPALVIDNFMMQSDQPLTKDSDFATIDKAYGGFVIEYGDTTEYKDFAAFQQHIKDVKTTINYNADKNLVDVSCQTGSDNLAMGVFTTYKESETLDKLYTYQTVNGKDAYLPTGVERDSPFNIQSRTGNLVKGDAILHCTAGQLAVLQNEPVSGTVFAANPLAELNNFSLQMPKGVEVTADGKLGISFITVQPKQNTVTIDTGFIEKQAEDKDAAQTILIFGMDKKTVITMNGNIIKAQEVKIDKRNALAVSIDNSKIDAKKVNERYLAVK
ncbi:MAG: hypothetical protein WCO98_05845 [bacterium]